MRNWLLSYHIWMIPIKAWKMKMVQSYKSKTTFVTTVIDLVKGRKWEAATDDRKTFDFTPPYTTVYSEVTQKLD